MRVTAGKYKNKQIKTIKSKEVRPTLSKIRESVFNMLQNHIDGVKMLDLFAGSGIMGVEAVSRGAKNVIYIEKNPRVARTLKENLRMFDFEYKVFINDAIKALDKLEGQKFDVIFADPPYAAGLLPDVLKKVAEHNLLEDDGVLIVECASDYNLDEEVSPYDIVISKKKVYGDTVIAFIKET